MASSAIIILATLPGIGYCWCSNYCLLACMASIAGITADRPLCIRAIIIVYVLAVQRGCKASVYLAAHMGAA